MSAEPSSPRQRILRRYWEILALLCLALPLAGLLYLNQQAEKLVYFKYGKAKWGQQRPAACTPARKKWVYGDLRPGHAGEVPLELTCEAALQEPKQEETVQNASGLPLHTVRYLTGSDAKRPWLVYISGATSTWLDATRYLPMARRLGFNLASLDMSNHGISGNNGKGLGFGCREKEDVVALLDRVAQAYPQADLFLAGTSTGTMAIANAAGILNKRPYAARIVATVLENPPSSVRDLMAFRQPHFPGFLYDLTAFLAGLQTGLDFGHCAPVNQLGQWRYPTLVQMPGQDNLVSPEMARKVYQALPTDLPKRFVHYPQGYHAALWNAQPQIFEADFKAIWETGLRFRQAQQAGKVVR
ncbi:hypothetical protein COW36_01005 [bacterium (Candidatus Blackallbacteria) CG17_big_fil_post_rev_8_21_14_2_50_48_46]|uniref:Serine aminopeptidase S33 domain-containing protein n=1 Tax=bacterium (Candidatus Blackallbacteria) CG17_big_fil_post_rev_8_21_14_2_50_48_46 TaxID=2014261 RepID=A0A2M7GB76_9BACT|nr:MAG: hypothetical protein COW64_10170 [bacterium (Candidatus Blackallbacteria) CG18_big_fil_WC_8_21_14_2_50_49_26]PIW19446.1 MAG: hypothetical protein COW36_01005 [bacterium (Candidatus Blackallbacteria) CG17_big_fil_post_rev_8_21_14_2_50_48_46]PIW48950.1 MAG: hypothetical protein COW20_07450 [bacterium (Candidatus Blackallbacteria) CG13_big_fil_rev_8_21_14_2_50_49_14]